MQKASMHHSEQTNPKTDILIVDDMPMNLELLAQILEYAGYSVREALSGTLALAAVEQKIPDLILLDVRMPEMDGFEVCQQLKASGATRDVPVIFISGLQDSADKIQGFNVGGIDFITKPFDQAEVLARVRIHLDLHSMQKSLETKVLQHTAELQKSNRALRMISRTNKILVRAKDQSSLLEAVCRVMIEVGGFHFCLLQCPQTDDNRRLKTVALRSASFFSPPMASALCLRASSSRIRSSYGIDGKIGHPTGLAQCMR